MNFKTIMATLCFIIIAVGGSIIGMLFGAFIVPFKILDGRCLSSPLKIKDKNNQNIDQI